MAGHGVELGCRRMCCAVTAAQQLQSWQVWASCRLKLLLPLLSVRQEIEALTAA